MPHHMLNASAARSGNAITAMPSTHKIAESTIYPIFAVLIGIVERRFSLFFIPFFFPRICLWQADLFLYSALAQVCAFRNLLLHSLFLPPFYSVAKAAVLVYRQRTPFYLKTIQTDAFVRFFPLLDYSGAAALFFLPKAAFSLLFCFAAQHKDPLRRSISAQGRLILLYSTACSCAFSSAC